LAAGHCVAQKKSFNGKAVAARKAPAPKAARMVTSAALKVAESLPLELEEGEMPMNTWKNKDPLSVKVRSVERIVGAKATGETCHIVMETDGKAPMWEGQSYGVIPPVSCLSLLPSSSPIVIHTPVHTPSLGLSQAEGHLLLRRATRRDQVPFTRATRAPLARNAVLSTSLPDVLPSWPYLAPVLH